MTNHQSDEAVEPQGSEPAPQGRRRRRVIKIISGVLLAYVLMAYALAPLLWRLYAHRHPALDDVPGITKTGSGIPGDPLNVAIIGSRAEVESAMKAAGWFSADPLSLRSDLEIAADTVLERPYAEAPVSSLYLFGRREDLAFEKPVGDNPRQRNHVRFWECANRDTDGSICWIGAATFDTHVGLSRTTGQVTHHVAPDIDTERNRLIQDLQQSGKIARTYDIDDFHKVRSGHNGGGDPWHTDGRLRVCVIAKTSSE